MGAGDVRRHKRRLFPTGRSVSSFRHAWKIAATVKADGRGGTLCDVSVAPGGVAWGGGFNATWPGATVGTIEGDGRRLVLWQTKGSPVPLANDPRFPSGDAPSCGCDDCSCLTLHGDPTKGKASAGEVVLTEEGATPEGATDWRVIGAVDVKDGSATVTQLLYSTITVRAILQAGENPGKDDPIEDPPPCGNPLNREDDQSNPLDRRDEGGGGGEDKDPEDAREEIGGPADKDDNPLDHEGVGGFTPKCGDETA